jgi:hypothetical protein
VENVKLKNFLSLSDLSEILEATDTAKKLDFFARYGEVHDTKTPPLKMP